MQRSFLCFVSKQQAEDSQVPEMKHLFISNLVALVLGNKAKEVALQSMFVTGKWMPLARDRGGFPGGESRAALRACLLLPMPVMVPAACLSLLLPGSSLLVLLNSPLRFVSTLHNVCSYAKVMCWCSAFLPDLPLLNLASMFCLTLKFNAQSSLLK